MTYVDGFVAAVPTANKDAFEKHAKEAAVVFREHGALSVMECWGDDVPDGKVTDFRRSVQAKEDETVAFSFVEWPDKTTRDAGMKRLSEMMKTDERMDPEKNPVPFDGKRMIFGGFAAVVDI